MNHLNNIQIGDLVLMLDAETDYFRAFVGTIGTVVADVCLRGSINLDTLERAEFSAYKVRLSDGTVVVVEPFRIRKLLPPESDHFEETGVDQKRPAEEMHG